MTAKVAINGFGRIGRAILRANYELEPAQRKIKIVAINDLGSPKDNAHLTEFDSTHGRFGKTIDVFEDESDKGEKLKCSEKNPVDLPWRVWVSMCVGMHRSTIREASKHLQRALRY